MSEKTRVLMALKSGNISVEKAENLLNALEPRNDTNDAKKDNQKEIIVDIKSIEGDNAHFNLPLSLLSILKGQRISLNSTQKIQEIVKEIDVQKLFDLVNKGVTGEIVNIKTAKGDRITVNIK
jgi:RecJ-like exonuclease